MLLINGYDNMKDLLLAFFTLLALLYIITGAVWLVQFYGWSRWTLVLPILLLINTRIRIKSE